MGGSKGALNANSCSLSERQISLVKDSWQMVVSYNGGLDTGRDLFVKLFEVEPELVQLFHNFAPDDSDDQLAEVLSNLDGHISKVLKTLTAAIELLDDIPRLESTLKDLGVRHMFYSVRPEQLEKFWTALDLVLKTKLREQYTPETREAWHTVTVMMATNMIKGMKADI